MQKNRKLGGRLFMAAGFMFFIAALAAHQPAFSAVGIALFVVGVAITKKAGQDR